jgi:hypothetical protein
MCVCGTGVHAAGFSVDELVRWVQARNDRDALAALQGQGWTADRVLREVAMKNHLLDWLADERDLRALAQPFADRPGFRGEWRTD